jgi:hypothetical protein
MDNPPLRNAAQYATQFAGLRRFDEAERDGRSLAFAARAIELAADSGVSLSRWNAGRAGENRD